MDVVLCILNLMKSRFYGENLTNTTVVSNIFNFLWFAEFLEIEKYHDFTLAGKPRGIFWVPWRRIISISYEHLIPNISIQHNWTDKQIDNTTEKKSSKTLYNENKHLIFSLIEHKGIRTGNWSLFDDNKHTKKPRYNEY